MGIESRERERYSEGKWVECELDRRIREVTKMK